MTLNEFIQELDSINITEQLSEKAIEFYNQLKEKSQNTFTENGKKILVCMQKNTNKYGKFNSKQLGELLFMSPRSVAGAMKKLLNEGYCKKNITNPVTYELTTLGKDVAFDK